MEKIHAPEGPGGFLEQLPDRMLVGDVEGQRDGGGAAGTDGLGHLRGRGGVDVGHHDVRSLGGQAPGAGRPDAVSPTGDNRHLAR